MINFTDGVDKNTFILVKGHSIVYFFTDFAKTGKTLLVSDDYYQPLSVAVVSDEEARAYYDELYVTERYLTQGKVWEHEED